MDTHQAELGGHRPIWRIKLTRIRQTPCADEHLTAYARQMLLKKVSYLTERSIEFMNSTIKSIFAFNNLSGYSMRQCRLNLVIIFYENSLRIQVYFYCLDLIALVGCDFALPSY